MYMVVSIHDLGPWLYQTHQSSKGGGISFTLSKSEHHLLTTKLLIGKYWLKTPLITSFQFQAISKPLSSKVCRILADMSICLLACGNFSILLMKLIVNLPLFDLRAPDERKISAPFLTHALGFISASAT
jgi:hypothetical protein